MERVEFEIKVYDNIIEIIPNESILDNSIYDIKLKNIKELHGYREISEDIKLCTALSPAYSSILSVNSLIEGIDVDEENILYHIREASRFVDYMGIVGKIDDSNVPYEVEQYVRYKAAHDSLLRFYIEKASHSGVKGQLGDVSYENKSNFKDISDLLKYLNANIKEWEDALRGYKLEGRAKPRHALRGKEASPIMTNLGLDYSRGATR